MAQRARRRGRRRLLTSERARLKRPRQLGVSKRDRTRPTAARLVPSTSSWWIATASHWPSVSRRLTHTTQLSCSHSSRPARRSSVRGGDWGGRANVRHSCTRTWHTTPRTSVALCARGITPRLARREIDSRERFGRRRWVVLLAARLPPPRRPLRAVAGSAPGVTALGLNPDLPQLPHPRGG